MKSFEEIQVSENLQNLANKLKKHGELFIVGGYVRNSLLGIGGTDIDLACRITVDELREYLKDTNYVVEDKNKKLGTAIITIGNEVFEYATFRVEKYDDSGKHNPVTVTFVDDIRQDARRRDFTVNAIYYSITRKKIVDIYSGLYDLKKRRIKTIETPEFVFANDGLRILRMIRIASELNFCIEKETYKIAKKMSYKLKDITGIRKQKELLQIFASNHKYKISNSKAHIRALEYFNKFNLWTSFYSTVSKIKLNMFKRVKQDKLYALFVDIINTVEPNNIQEYLEIMLGENGLQFPARQKDYLINIICGYFDALNKLNNRDYFFKYYDYFEKIGKILAKKNIFLFNKYNFFYNYITNYHVPIKVKDICVDGNDIKKNNKKIPEKYYGKILQELLKKVFDGEILNIKEDLIMEIKNYDITNN